MKVNQKLSQHNLLLKYLHYAIPSVVAMWVFSIYTMVDGYFVGRYDSETALSAINLAMPFVNTVFAMAIIFAVGTSTVVGMLLGGHRNKDACQIFTFSTFSLLCFALIIVVVSFINIDFIVNLLGARGTLFTMVHNYTRIILWFIPFFMISYHFEIMVKIDGFPTLATVGVISSAIANICLDYLFVGVFGWGITGAAWATGIAQVISTLLFLIHFIDKKSKLSFSYFTLKQGLAKILFRIVSIGTGDFLSELSTGFIVFVYNQFLLAHLGNESLITYTIISYFNLLVATSMAGLVQGMQPLISFFHGQGDSASGKTILRYTIVSIGILSLLAIFIGTFTPGTLIKIFLNANSPLLHTTEIAMRKYSISFIFLGFNLMFVGLLAALGYSRSSVALSSLRGFFMVLISLEIITSLLPGNMIWYSATVSECVSLIFAIFLAKKQNILFKVKTAMPNA